MRLTVPEPSISLYKDGFAQHDQLNRKETGDKLSELVERIDDPLVIALDGAWGSGKTFFLKCWVGEHLQREGNSTQTVYFDAFQNDFLDDPLIALTAEIFDSRFHGPSPVSDKIFTKIREAAPRVGRGLFRAGVAMATAGIVQNADELGDAAAEAIGGELSRSASEFWKKEDDKRAAMKAFKDGLIALTEPTTKDEAEANPELKEGVPKRKLVIVIDELDRCRPDYALSLLEIIKHFFNVDGVHFVLGVNLKELQNSVRARYGSSVDARTYLQKFISLTMHLPVNVHHNDSALRYFEHLADQLSLDSTRTSESLDFLYGFSGNPRLELRNIEKFATVVALLPTSFGALVPGYRFPILLGAFLMSQGYRQFEEYRTGKIAVQEISELFDLSRSEEAVMIELLAPKEHTEETKELASKMFRGRSPAGERNFLGLLTENYLQVFQT